ncbi:hypothetical protein DRO49_05065 [Candidatus Bathyarchaeota archaeon]|nr:MAG: hypothetical protein DRO49_05065 [Candidatus Bathyarchaeota archaeon]
MMAEAGIAGLMLDILREVYMLGEATPTDLSKALSRSMPQISRYLTKLEKRNLIERKRDPINRRRKIVKITSEGIKFLKQMKIELERQEADGANLELCIQKLEELIKANPNCEVTNICLDLLELLSARYSFPKEYCVRVYQLFVNALRTRSLKPDYRRRFIRTFAVLWKTSGRFKSTVDREEIRSLLLKLLEEADIQNFMVFDLFSDIVGISLIKDELLRRLESALRIGDEGKIEIILNVFNRNRELRLALLKWCLDKLEDAKVSNKRYKEWLKDIIYQYADIKSGKRPIIIISREKRHARAYRKKTRAQKATS